ncbi:MAG: replicative DNA helicase [Actinobacteria bacterium]|nr:replicative DNA helicase [Actinomycetota bacterium]
MAVAEVPPGPQRGDGRVPPYNLEAEESLLGAMLLSKDAIVAASELGVSSEDFYKPVHGHIFDAILSLYGAGEPADPVTVGEELRRAGLLGDIGGPGLLVSLQVRTPATSSAARYARIVGEHALLRRLIAVAGEIAEMGYRVPDDVAEAVDRAEAMVFDVAQHRVSDTMAPIRDLLDHTLTRLEMLYEKADSITGVPTGYRGFDELLSGLQPSSLVIVGARPATGKCLTGDTLLVEPRTGARVTLAEVYRRGRRGDHVEVTSLGAADHGLHVRRPNAFVDDGVRPVFRVRTRLGREVRTTAAHPFLTPTGWRPLAEVAVGTPVAVPRVLPVFGNEARPRAEIVLLAYLLSDGAHTGASVRFTATSPAVIDDLAHHARQVEVEAVTERSVPGVSTCRLHPPADRSDPWHHVLGGHGLMGTSPHRRSVPEWVFRLPRRQVALFLNRLLGVDGSLWWSTRQGGTAYVSYCSRSGELVADVAHLLLRFGINARRRRRVIHRQGWSGPAHELEVTSVPELRHLATEIGMFSKDSALANLLAHIDQLDHRQRRASQAPRALAHAASPAGPGAPHRTPAGRRPAARDSTDAPCAPAPTSVLWDEVVAIDDDGPAQVYDLTVPGDHNFVAADVFVHNTAFALGMAAHAALEAHRPVLFFSLEMSHLEITQRLLASEARVDSTRMRNGRLAESDWTKISHAIGRLAEAPLYIDDNPRATVLEIRAKARRLKSRLGDLGIVVVDYLQLMTGRDRAENRQVEVSEISRGLKVLARELQTPVVALSQLSRGLELRADKRPMLADLRESGCLTADARVLRADTGAEVTMGELLLSGERDIPVWTVDRDLALVAGTMSHVFASGTKPVYRLRLGSGRRIDASANHPFLTVGGWLRLDELAIGTRVAVPRRLPAPTRRCEWAVAEVREAAREVVEATDRLPADCPVVPRAIFSLPDDALVAFLAAVWPHGDGVSHHGHRPRPHCVSASSRLIDDLQTLLLRLEVHSRVVRLGSNAAVGRARLSIEGDESSRRFGELMAGAMALAGQGAGQGVAPPSRHRLAQVAAALDDAALDRRARADVRWDPVVAIDSLGERPVYDATVAETHNFVANGIVVENSLEQDADVVVFLYRDELYHPESPDRGTAEVLVAKHRSGPTGMDRLAFLDHYTRFANMAKDI